MNIWAITCLILSVPFGIMAVIFTLLKEKCAVLISGFNTLSKEEREEYDKNKMSIDMRNSLYLWFAILLLGAALSYFFSNYCAMIAIVVWMILFFKDVHFDTEKAFAKYRKHNI